MAKKMSKRAIRRRIKIAKFRNHLSFAVMSGKVLEIVMWSRINRIVNSDTLTRAILYRIDNIRLEITQLRKNADARYEEINAIVKEMIDELDS